MALADGQLKVRDLVMGEGTNFEVIGFNPWQRTVRANQHARTWNHGAWSGAEWYEAVTVNFTICVSSIDPLDPTCQTIGDFDTWISRRHIMTSAFRPIGDTGETVELHFRYGSQEYVMFGRPRLVDPNPEWISWVRPGGVAVDAAFEALDPFIYGGQLITVGPISLPVYEGGLTVPFTVPFIIDAFTVGGEAELVNSGTAPTGLTLRFDGPLTDPFATLVTPDGVNHTIRVNYTLDSNDSIIVDTADRTAVLNGTTSVRSQVTGEFFLLPPGTSTIELRASAGTGTLTVSYRPRWY